MTEQQETPTSTKKEKDFYKKNPNILMYFSVENNSVIFDYDETKLHISDAILLAHNTVNEFLKTIATQLKQQEQQAQIKSQEQQTNQQ
jgi:hypothetical protein